LANNSLINNFSFSSPRRRRNYPLGEQSLRASPPHVEHPCPKIQDLISFTSLCLPLSLSLSLSLFFLYLCLYIIFCFSRTTHRLSPADQARCWRKRLAQYLCCACTRAFYRYIYIYSIQMYIFILFYSIYAHVRNLDIFFLVYCVLQIFETTRIGPLRMPLEGRVCGFVDQRGWDRLIIFERKCI